MRRASKNRHIWPKLPRTGASSTRSCLPSGTSTACGIGVEENECRDPPLPGTQLTGPCLSVIRLSDIRLTGRITLGPEFGRMCAPGDGQGQWVKGDGFTFTVPVPSHDRPRGWDRWDPQSMLISTGGGDILRLLLLVSDSEHDAVWRLVDRRSQGESSPLRTGVLARAWVFRVG
jgi:hypothetical protein